ncbi:hypothetical protein [Gemmatimonas sp.]|uniref:hypothetical protein n=1 Tax=Gemmatimonas sp. TaxID=1962908 RepID=UPI00286BA62F|nr:hypothetical protein [Gemmatimonas sp.]
MLRLVLRALLVLALLAPVGAPLAAQQRDSVTAKPVPAPIIKPAAPVSPLTQRGRFTPPLTPKRAFLYSSLLPGFGQSRLDRGTSGALFASIELAAIVMMRRSQMDLREARRFQIDTLPGQYLVSGDSVVKNGVFTNGFTRDLVRTRRLHVEDWIAVVAFNHLFAGADAFVSAQLWDVPLELSAYPRPSGAVFAATIRF